MSWLNDGDWNGVIISSKASSFTGESEEPDLKTIMFQLFTAINERQQFMQDYTELESLAPTEFNGNDGNQYLASEFAFGEKFAGTFREFDSIVKSNILLMQGYIDAMVTSVYWLWARSAVDRTEVSMRTTAELLGLGTHGTTWIDPEGLNFGDLTPFDQIRDALDSLKYPVYSLIMTRPWNDFDHNIDLIQGFGVSATNSWSDMLSNPYSDSGEGSFGVGEAVFQPWTREFNPTSFTSQIFVSNGTDAITYDWLLSGINGVVLNTIYLSLAQTLGSGFEIDVPFVITMSKGTISIDSIDRIKTDFGDTWPSSFVDESVESDLTGTTWPAYPWSNTDGTAPVDISLGETGFYFRGGDVSPGGGWTAFDYTHSYIEWRPNEELTYG